MLPNVVAWQLLRQTEIKISARLSLSIFLKRFSELANHANCLLDMGNCSENQGVKDSKD